MLRRTPPNLDVASDRPDLVGPAFFNRFNRHDPLVAQIARSGGPGRVKGTWSRTTDLPCCK